MQAANPITDSLHYLTALHPWTAAAFDVLLAANLVIALWCLASQRDQRTGFNLSVWLARTVVGTLWWQQVIWKVPPNEGGLRFWTEQMVRFDAFSLQRSFVSHVVLPHFGVFAPLVFVWELVIAVSLLLGVFTRVGSLLGLLMAVNLWFGLYNSPSEWIWSYVMLTVLMFLFSVTPPGRSLGLDSFLMAGRSRLARWSA